MKSRKLPTVFRQACLYCCRDVLGPNDRRQVGPPSGATQNMLYSCQMSSCNKNEIFHSFLLRDQWSLAKCWRRRVDHDIELFDPGNVRQELYQSQTWRPPSLSDRSVKRVPAVQVQWMPTKCKHEKSSPDRNWNLGKCGEWSTHWAGCRLPRRGDWPSWSAG